MFAQPFLAALDDHTDGVYSSATSPTSLVSFVSGAADGEVIVWDLALRQKLWSVYAHRGFVRGLSVASDGDTFFSCGDDRIIRQWRMAAQARDAAAAVASSGSKRPRAAATPAEGDETGDKAAEVEPLATWGGGKSAYTYIDCHWANPARFATSSLAVNVWDTGRSEPIHTYSWGADTVTTVRFNPAEV
jgi:WD repeat and SOF domain-containing protein 1